MKRKGCSILFVNSNDQLLLFLRDDIPGLPYANMWDIPGGHVDEGEMPQACIEREMKEEIGVDLNDFTLFHVYEFNDRTEYVFLKFWDLDIDSLVLTEGQALRWFSEQDILKTELAYGFNRVAENFFEQMRMGTLPLSGLSKSHCKTPFFR
ncbi:MAG: NUDIX hydrolase [Proteobacteria bacterium]|nr:NUDIX hydrolase [Pseudomonadota bacterium]